MLEITWLGHGTFQFRLETGEIILMDPWLQNPTYPKGHSLDRVDALLITHGHFDHIHDAVQVARQFKPKVIAVYETAQWLGSKGVENVSAMNKGGTQDAGPVKVTMTHAEHSSGITEDEGKIIYGGEAAGYVLKLPDGRVIYFAGDTNVFSDMQIIEQLFHPELAFIPVGDLYTMDPKAAALACRLVRPKTVVPMHFGTFPALTGAPQELRDLLKDTGIRVMELQPGRTVKW